jgi:hypothetical protein
VVLVDALPLGLVGVYRSIPAHAVHLVPPEGPRPHVTVRESELPTDPLLVFLTASDAERLYAAPSHSVCTLDNRDTYAAVTRPTFPLPWIMPLYHIPS